MAETNDRCPNCGACRHCGAPAQPVKFPPWFVPYVPGPPWPYIGTAGTGVAPLTVGEGVAPLTIGDPPPAQPILNTHIGGSGWPSSGVRFR